MFRLDLFQQYWVVVVVVVGWLVVDVASVIFSFIFFVILNL